MLGNHILFRLSEFNCKSTGGDELRYLGKEMLSLERRLLLRRLHSSLHDKKASVTDVSLWERLSKLLENYRRIAWLKCGSRLNLQSPLSFAEKLEWLKFNDHREIYVQLSDKLGVRNYVEEKTGNSSVLNRLLGVYESTDQIPFEELPDNYVIKTNHWSGGGSVLCSENKPVQSNQLKVLDKCLNKLYSPNDSEWPYWHIQPKVFVEEYLKDQFSQLIDYKVHCFNGKPEFVMVVKDRFAKQTRLMFDLNWELLPFRYLKYPPIEEGAAFPKPDSLNEMLHYSSQLSEGFSFLRADFYDIGGECRFGELTFYPDSGRDCILYPSNWNAIVGGWLQLPEPLRNPKFAFSKLV